MPPTPSSPDADGRRRRIALLALGPLVVVVVGALLFVSLHSRNSNAVPAAVTIAGRAEVGKPAPVFTAKALDGSRVSLASYRGKALIVSFGASWCYACNQEYPLLVKAAADHPNDLAVVAVMHDDLPRDEKAFARKYHARWPAIDDSSNAISNAYGVVGLPQTVFITPAGVVQDREFGITSQGALNGPLNRLLATAR